jgi:hypothetical protein
MNKNYKNLGTKISKNPRTKITKTRNKSYKNLENKITNIKEQKIQKSRNKSYKNPGTNFLKI